MRYLSNLNLSHSFGHDNLSTVILKYIANKISECLTLIINQSQEVYFRTSWKLQKPFPYLRKMIKHKLKTIDQFLFYL